jgi:CelD/BcsL family acetyltransferase involved in cellulose biosynthesis
MLTLQVISDTARFDALEQEWNALAERFQTPLLRHEWFAACFKAFGEGKELAVFTVRENGTLRAAAPFIVDRDAIVPKLMALGHETTEPHAFLFADEASLRALADGILRHRLPLVMPRLRADGPELRALQAATGWRGAWFTRAGNTATATVPLSCDFTTFESRMASADCSNIRRRRKLAERTGGQLSVEILTPTAADAHRHLRLVYEVESKGWKTRAGTAILSDAKLERFCNEYGAKAAQMGILRVFCMRAGGTPIAAAMILEYGGRLWGLKQGYDEQWSPCAPGILLAQDSIRYACERGLNAYEFLGSAEKFQTRWPIELTPYSRARYYPFSLLSLAAICIDACRLPFNYLTWRWRSKSGSLSEFIRPSRQVPERANGV